jgi:hypothetical protein
LTGLGQNSTDNPNFGYKLSFDIIYNQFKDKRFLINSMVRRRPYDPKVYEKYKEYYKQYYQKHKDEWNKVEPRYCELCDITVNHWWNHSKTRFHQRLRAREMEERLPLEQNQPLMVSTNTSQQLLETTDG